MEEYCGKYYQSACDSRLAFKKEYFDYREVETTRDGWTAVETEMNTNTRDADAVSTILRIYSIFMGSGNIYDYEFEEQDDKYVLTTKVVGIGLNTDVINKKKNGSAEVGIDDSEYAINLYYRRYIVDKADGDTHLDWHESEYDNISGTGKQKTSMEVIKTIPISEEESKKVFSIYGELNL